MSSLSEIFAPDGPLASAIGGYRVRGQQVEMAERVAEAIDKQAVFIAEAGTGTGKTFAYLVPALRSGGKVIVSTGTKTLQDQLFNKDLPMVRDALKAPVKIALLKGRANYVCPYHLDNALLEGRFMTREDAADARRISNFAKTTQSGDKAECIEVNENSPVWNHATSTRDNCLGQECPSYKDCFVMQARREAMAADLVVVNHHLFFADVMLRDEGMAELLPACNTVIFDEAHQLPEVATLFFGDSVSTAQVLDLARDARAEGLANARDCLALTPASKALEKVAKDLRLAVGIDAGRFSHPQLQEKAEFAPALQALEEEVASFAALLETQAARAEGLEKCWQRALELQQRLAQWQNPVESGYVRWAEAFTQSLQLNATPLDVANIFRKQMGGHPRAWIFTSATLAVQGKFHHYCAELGLGEPDSGCWHSPFDYGEQAVLYAPLGMPDPNAWNYTDTVVEAAFPALRAAGGGAFFLCTSLRAMRRTHELLKAKLEDEGLDMPLLVQGEGSKNDLLQRFRHHGRAVLVGSQSFWEGVDVRGEALSLVVIDKIPFAPPDDPVLSARIEEMKKQGRNAFMEYQLPRAVINVKQGAGRLIRDESDKGVLMICDPRLISKPYGRRVWQSLPPMKRTRELQVVLDFFAQR
ncbi:ATP-dependent DNA helicase [Dechloromonas sp.]|uniref:ATP-dependent DNA helicase n=1 Tax=Dechloromonas sp. TaxID=1917218 RepID=UPI0012058F9B|nr:ATP-dependent DNA helicase [Dechloromonas sp.]MBU3697946.1 ATP-dependent DNA helicase [Dechloromonas sp.]TEX50043.1 MAG: helicase [Rhodocyclaceae bacterium]